MGRALNWHSIIGQIEMECNLGVNSRSWGASSLPTLDLVISHERSRTFKPTAAVGTQWGSRLKRGLD